MTSIYEVILQFINALFPNDLQTAYGAVNDLLAYVLTLCFMWSIIIRPVLKAFRVVK